MDHKSKKILIIDDDIISSKKFARSLNKHDFTCFVVTSSKDAYIYINKKSIDMIILNISMEEFSGIAILNYIREKYTSQQMPVILTSDNASSSDIDSALEHGANDFLPKSILPDLAIPRLSNHFKMVELYKDHQDFVELADAKELVTRYSQNISGPLSLALGSLPNDISNIDSQQLDEIINALDKIGKISKDIEDVASGDARKKF